MTIIHKSNVAYAGPAVPEVSQLSRSAADLYALYSARVVADGGAVQNAAACQAAFDAALKGGYLYKAGWAISPSWGIKKTGTVINKFYSLNGGIDGVCTGQIDLDTTTMPTPTALFDNVLDVVTFTGVNLNKTDIMGYVGSAHHASTLQGLTLLYTPVAQQWNLHEATGELLIAAVSKIKASPEFPTPDNTASAILIEQLLPKFTLWQDGTKKKVTTNALTTLALNQAATMTIQKAGTNAFMNEIWYFNAATESAVEKCSSDVGGRY